jgi:hypothetical protein
MAVLCHACQTRQIRENLMAADLEECRVANFQLTSDDAPELHQGISVPRVVFRVNFRLHMCVVDDNPTERSG